jgi:hypothetical protein
MQGTTKRHKSSASASTAAAVMKAMKLKKRGTGQNNNNNDTGGDDVMLEDDADRNKFNAAWPVTRTKLKSFADMPEQEIFWAMLEEGSDQFIVDLLDR